MSLSPPPPWQAQLRAQGRSMTWLAQQVGVQRTYLQDVAKGRKRASPELQARIDAALSPLPDRLAQARDHAEWRRIERAASELAGSIRAQLGASPQVDECTCDACWDRRAAQ